jgi:hypothetical protein
LIEVRIDSESVITGPLFSVSQLLAKNFSITRSVLASGFSPAMSEMSK